MNKPWILPVALLATALWCNTLQLAVRSIDFNKPRSFSVAGFNVEIKKEVAPSTTCSSCIVLRPSYKYEPQFQYVYPAQDQYSDLGSSAFTFRMPTSPTANITYTIPSP